MSSEGHLGVSKSESFLTSPQDALPWQTQFDQFSGGVAETFIYRFSDRLFLIHTWSMIVFDIGKLETGVRNHLISPPEPIFHTQKKPLPNPLPANETAAARSAVISTPVLLWLQFDAARLSSNKKTGGKKNHHLISFIWATELRMKGWMMTGLMNHKLCATFNSMCGGHCCVNMPKLLPVLSLCFQKGRGEGAGHRRDWDPGACLNLF